jgi:plasmid stabilization system protein ParE
MRLIWKARALRDLKRLREFLIHENPDAARRAIQTIRESVKILSMTPLIGRPADIIEPGYREWIVPFGGRVYIVLYRVEGRTVALLAARHGREIGYKED